MNNNFNKDANQGQRNQNSSANTNQGQGQRNQNSSATSTQNQGQKAVNPVNTMNQQNRNNHNHQQKPALNQAKEAKLLNMPAEEHSSGGWLVTAVILAVILLASGWLISKHNASVAKNTGDATDVLSVVTQGQEKSAETPAANPADANPSAEAKFAGEVKVVVSDQPASKTVAISSMSFDKVSWVAIRDVKTQWIKGARRFEPGTKSGIVLLVKSLIKGEKYEAVVYTDNGDKVFNLHKDTLVPGVVSSFVAK